SRRRVSSPWTRRSALLTLLGKLDWGRLGIARDTSRGSGGNLLGRWLLWRLGHGGLCGLWCSGCGAVLRWSHGVLCRCLPGRLHRLLLGLALGERLVRGQAAIARARQGGVGAALASAEYRV